MTSKAVHIMVDIETLSTEANAAILSLGAVDFSDGVPSNDVSRGFYAAVTPLWYDTHPLASRFHISASAAVWWMGQNASARQAITDAASSVTLPAALDAFTEYLKTRCEGDFGRVRIWGNGAAFDNPILASAYKSCGTQQPWNYRNNRCYRTIAALYTDVPRPESPQNDHHHAFKDAAYQAEHLLAIAAAHKLDLTNL